jgi:hypothetical protein
MIICLLEAIVDRGDVLFPGRSLLDTGTATVRGAPVTADLPGVPPAQDAR